MNAHQQIYRATTSFIDPDGTLIELHYGASYSQLKAFVDRYVNTLDDEQKWGLWDGIPKWRELCGFVRNDVSKWASTQLLGVKLLTG